MSKILLAGLFLLLDGVFFVGFAVGGILALKARVGDGDDQELEDEPNWMDDNIYLFEGPLAYRADMYDGSTSFYVPHDGDTIFTSDGDAVARVEQGEWHRLPSDFVVHA